MNCQIIDKKIDSIASDIQVVFIVNKDLKHFFIQDKEDLKMLSFMGEDNSSCYISKSKTLYVGVDNLDDLDYLRVACAHAIKFCLNKNITSIKIASYFKDDKLNALISMVEGLYLGYYTFDKHKSKKTTKNIQDIYISNITTFNKKSINIKIATKAVDIAIANSKATNFTRDIVNRTPNDITPTKLAKISQKLADKYNLKSTILNQKDLEKLKMGAFLAVSRASINPPKLIHLKYKHKNPKKRLVLIGKGLTYDSGGLSLKPADFMVTMKCDKAGSATVLGIMKGVCELQLPIQLDIIIGACENMIGGDAYKPDDVLTSMSGKTIEVRNTDAEGRLVLADCLTYAQEQIKDFDYIIDYATLTGACAVALGQYTSGVMGHNRYLKNEFELAGEQSGDLINPLNFNKHLTKLINSNIADICNIASSRYGGALTAGLFLDNFIKKENKDKWIHMDIAGPAYVEQEWGCNPIGASGSGVRATLSWLNQILGNNNES
jgi:leucyl aminopeptidase